MATIAANRAGKSNDFAFRYKRVVLRKQCGVRRAERDRMHVQ
jgi:hypothetical protein